MQKFLNALKKGKWLLLAVIVLGFLYFGFNTTKNKIVANSFFDKYDVLTAVGNDHFHFNAISLNGKTIMSTEEEWTNVLPVPDSLKFILMANSYSKGKDIECGGKTIKKAPDSIGGVNTWCINHNGNERAAVAGANYYPYDVNDIVYETCLKEKYYERRGRGINGCAEAALFLNDKQIAKTTEQYTSDPLTGERYLEPASTFNYHPSKRIGSNIVFTNTNGTFAYNVSTEKTKLISDNKISKLEDIFQTDGGAETIFVNEEIVKNSYEKNFPGTLGSIDYDGKKYSNVYSADYIDGNLYILRLQDIKKKGSDSVATYELLINGRKVDNFEFDNYILFGYSVDAISSFPLCDTGTLVCVYEGGHYAYKNLTTVPEVFSYDFDVSEMVIDGEWRGEHIPDLIGRSKPIFENGKLKYIVYSDEDGLYMVDFDKKWDFASIYRKSITTVVKLLNGNQNKLLNVVNKN